MNFIMYLWDLFLSIIWPPKGIIYFESQMLMGVYAYTKVWFIYHGAEILIALAIIFAISCAVFGRTRMRLPRNFVGRVLGTILRVLTNIAFAWILLVYGAVRGQLENTNGEENARISYNRRVHTGRIWNIVHSFTRLSLHFNLGRWLFRISYRLLGHIHQMRENERRRVLFARVIALIIIFWGVWWIPYDLTH